MDQLSRSFSHEFGTLLNFIHALAQSALVTIKTESILADFIRPILNSSFLMDSFINDFRDFSMVLSKKFQLKIEQNVDLKQEVVRVSRLFQRQLECKGIVFDLQIEENCQTTISSDLQRIGQVLVNLMSNASKFTFQGKITVQLQQWIHCNIPFIKVSVIDTGVGMSQQNQDLHIQRLNHGKTTDIANVTSSGTFGFGLIISDLISQNLGNLKRGVGGGIQFKSQYGEGSIFSFLLYDYTPDLQVEQQSFTSLLRITKHAAIFQEKQNEQSQNQFQRQHQVSIQVRNVFKHKNLQYEAIEKSDNQMMQKIENNFVNSSDRNIIYDIPSDTASPIIDELHLHKKQTLVRFPNKYQTSTKQRSYKLVQNERTQVCPKKCKSILIIDDEYFNILALQTILKTFDLLADSALNGKIAIDMVNARLERPCECGAKYKIILMDINMPEIDGFLATKIIIGAHQGKQVEQPTIIAQTAFGDVQTKALCYDSGMKFFLTKPISKQELKKIIKQLGLL